MRQKIYTTVAVLWCTVFPAGQHLIGVIVESPEGTLGQAVAVASPRCPQALRLPRSTPCHGDHLRGRQAWGKRARLRKPREKIHLLSLPRRILIQLTCRMHSGFKCIAIERGSGMNLNAPWVTALELLYQMLRDFGLLL